VRKLFLLSLLLLAGCRTAADRRDIHYSAALPVAPTGVVFVANGSGNVHTVSDNLGQIVAHTGTPLQIQSFEWSHGDRRYIYDHVDHDNHLCQGERLAADVCAYGRACPGRRIYLVGYSSGAAVTLAAAERLPPASVDRIVLLAPAVCVCHDLRPSLRTARCGIDVFYSPRDRFVLGVGMRTLGTADRCCRVAAGQYGFTPVVSCPEDAALYGKLRQHPWDPVVEWTGNTGGHYGSDQAGFLRAYVLPLLTER
jgi:pimeloyl-ACP methyl ester carboxylesterase